jgi:hypothetical protein
MSNDVEQLFIYLLAFCMSSLEICLSKSFTHFQSGCLLGEILSYLSALPILDINPLSDTCLVNIFSYFVSFLSDFVYSWVIPQGFTLNYVYTDSGKELRPLNQPYYLQKLISISVSSPYL